MPTEEICWLAEPLFTNAGGGEVRAGVDSDGVWFVGLDAPELAHSERASVVLLPLMQDGFGGDFVTARAMVTARLCRTGLPEDLVDTFPFHAPVLAALRRMRGWIPFAIRWLDHVKLDPDAIVLLEDIQSDPAIPQNARHAIQHTLKRRRGVRSEPHPHDPGG